MLRPLHSKGVLTLCLLVWSETVSVSNAVASWNDVQRRVHGSSSSSGSGSPGTGGTTHQRGACPATTTTTTTTTTSSSSSGSGATMNTVVATTGVPQPTLRRFFAARKKKIPSKDCCVDCTHCMKDDHIDRICRLSRGGHLTAGGASEIAATPYGIPLHLWKVIFQALLTAINVVCWLVPLKSKRISENKLGLSLANAFSGGVFLSLAFGHLIPECVSGFSDQSASLSLPEATPYLLVLSGYLLIFFVEKVAFDAHDILHEMGEGSGGGGGAHGPPPLPPVEATKALNGAATSTSSSPTTTTTTTTTTRTRSSSIDSHNKDGGVSTTASSGRSAVILLGALAVHSVLEMMALGLSKSFGDCALLSLSIALHQPAESIALLVAFLKSGMPHSQVLQFLSVFSAMGPVGVALGMAVNEFAAPIVDSVMLAIVAGTFVYVGATEVIPEEWEDSEHKWKKFSALMAGIVSILAITQYTMSLGH